MQNSFNHARTSIKYRWFKSKTWKLKEGYEPNDQCPGTRNTQRHGQEYIDSNEEWRSTRLFMKVKLGPCLSPVTWSLRVRQREAHEVVDLIQMARTQVCNQYTVTPTVNSEKKLLQQMNRNQPQQLKDSEQFQTLMICHPPSSSAAPHRCPAASVARDFGFQATQTGCVPGWSAGKPTLFRGSWENPPVQCFWSWQRKACDGKWSLDVAICLYINRYF